VVDAISEKIMAQKAQTLQEVRKEQANNPMALIRVNNAVAKQAERDTAVEKALMKALYGEEDPKKQRRAHAAGYTKTYTGGRAQGRKDGSTIRTTNAKASLGSGRGQIGGGQ
jgi:hypothetical protein